MAILVTIMTTMIGLWDLPPCSGKVKSFDKFDNEFFGYDSKQVDYVDPQDRKLLETTFEAILDAGKRVHVLRGCSSQRTGTGLKHLNGESEKENVVHGNPLSLPHTRAR